MVEHNVITKRPSDPLADGGQRASTGEGQVGDDAIKGEENGSDKI